MKKDYRIEELEKLASEYPMLSFAFANGGLTVERKAQYAQYRKL